SPGGTGGATAVSKARSAGSNSAGLARRDVIGRHRLRVRYRFTSYATNVPTVMPAVAPIAPSAVMPTAVAPPVPPGELLLAVAGRRNRAQSRFANGGPPFGHALGH